MGANRFVQTSDAVSLHVRDEGDGVPVLFLHEYAGDERSWSRQVAELKSQFRCVTFAARGYLPSDVPTSPAAYSWQRAVDDVLTVLDALDITTAHVVGLSMGAYTALQLGLRRPDRVRSVMAVSAGTGSDRGIRQAYVAEANHIADLLRSEGCDVVGRLMAVGSSRVQLKQQNEPAWHEFIAQFSDHSAEGLALTILQIQASRPSLQDPQLIEDFRGFSVPLLVMNGDEDNACLSTGLMLKDTVPACGMLVLPNSGHVPNLESPSLFNDVVRQFVRCVESNTWPERDPRSRARTKYALGEAEPAEQTTP